jgi:hypothetical protein
MLWVLHVLIPSNSTGLIPTHPAHLASNLAQTLEQHPEPLRQRHFTLM